MVRLANDDQRAVGLDGAGEMDLLALAVGEVRGSKSRRWYCSTVKTDLSGGETAPNIDPARIS